MCCRGFGGNSPSFSFRNFLETKKNTYEGWSGENDVSMDVLYPKKCPKCHSGHITNLPDTVGQFINGMKKCISCGEAFSTKAPKEE